jgi:scyllo-inositol 2-dehydrogenase (NADP+)
VSGPVATGLIGYGLAGRAIHAPAIAGTPGLGLRAVATRQGEALQADWPGVPAVDPLALIEDSAIELVVVATPNEQHFPLARQALERGKHVIVDKPFAETWAQASELTQLAESSGRLLSVFHNRRWDGDFRLLQQVLAEGRVGRPVLLESRFDRFRRTPKDRWRERPGIGAGVWYDLGPHLIDQALLLLGLPQTLTAHIGAFRDGAEVDDDVLVVLGYPRMRVVLRASSLAAIETPRFTLLGDDGAFTKAWFDPVATPGAPPPPGLLTRADGRTEELQAPPGDARDYYAAIAAALRDGGANPVPPREALAVMAVLELARESAAQGRTLPVGGDPRLQA